MPNLTIEDVPEEIHREFQQLTEEERRRLGDQIVSSLQDRLLKPTRSCFRSLMR